MVQKLHTMARAGEYSHENFRYFPGSFAGVLFLVTSVSCDCAGYKSHLHRSYH